MSAELAATYRQAAEIVAVGGHCKGSYRRDGAHCTVGALRAAMGQTYVTAAVTAAVVPLADLLGRPVIDTTCKCGEMHQVDPLMAVTEWNDLSRTTKSDVVELLTQAAEKMEANL